MPAGLRPSGKLVAEIEQLTRASPDLANMAKQTLRDVLGAAHPS